MANFARVESDSVFEASAAGQIARPVGAEAAASRRRSHFLALIPFVVVTGVALSGCQSQAAPSVPPGTATADETPAPDCVAPKDAKQQDIDPKDSAEKPWPRLPGQKVTVYFENQGVSSRYWNGVQTAADIWSRSPCVRALAVPDCPPKSNCVQVKQQAFGLWQPRTDGEFSGTDGGEYRRGGTIKLYTWKLDKGSDNGALATIVHEMGHALGLTHRTNNNDVMNANTSDSTNANPDNIDFANLLVIYGAAGGT